MASSAARNPHASTIGGSAIAAEKPPIGIAVWRIPRAKPRSARGNQLVTARPVAVFELAPKALASARTRTSETNAGA